MAEKPVILQPEIVPETAPAPAPATATAESTLPNPEPAVAPAPETWTKFPPQVDRSSANKPSRGLMWLVIILIAIAVAIVGLAVRQFMSKPNDVRTIVSDDTTSTPKVDEPTATPSPTPEITDKSEVKIQVLNGSGVAGEAGEVAMKLESLGFEDIDAGNGDDTEGAAQVSYSPKLDTKIVNEVKETLLLSFFDNVELVQDDSLSDYHIIITTAKDQGSTM